MDHPVYTIARRNMILGCTHAVNSINNYINIVYCAKHFSLRLFYIKDRTQKMYIEKFAETHIIFNIYKYYEQY